MKTTASQVDDDFGMNILFVVLTLVTYLTSFASGQIVFMTKAGFLFVACGLLYLVLGVVTLPRYQQKGVRATYLHLLLQLLVGALIYYLSRGQGWLIMLPVLGQSVEVLPARERNLMLFLHLLVVLGVTILLVNPGGAAGTHLSFWVAVLISVLQYALAAVFVVLFTLVAVRERAARAEVEELAAQLESANRKLRAYTAQVEELAVVKERNRLAREIHDGLGHYLTAINMQIQAGLSVLDHDRARALTALAHAQQLTQEGLSEVRRSVAALRASSLDKFSLAEAVEKLLTACSASGLKNRFPGGRGAISACCSDCFDHLSGGPRGIDKCMQACPGGAGAS